LPLRRQDLEKALLLWLLSFGPAKESDPGAERTECEQGHRVAIKDYRSIAWGMAGVSATPSTSKRIAESQT
jgi:hypothetical protein